MNSKRVMVAFVATLLTMTIHAQAGFEKLVQESIQKGFCLLRQDYQVLNEDDEPITLKMGRDFYGRVYVCGVRIGEGQFIVPKEFTQPWVNEALVVSEKRHPEISYSGVLELNTKEFDAIDANTEGASELVTNHAYTVDGSEVSGFEIDNTFGRKKGYAVWLESATRFDADTAPTGITLKIQAMNITTNEDNAIYSITNQPTGHVVGGAFLVPSSERTGNISIKVNGIFEKRGGVWKMVSFGTDEPDD